MTRVERNAIRYKLIGALTSGHVVTEQLGIREAKNGVLDSNNTASSKENLVKGMKTRHQNAYTESVD